MSKDTQQLRFQSVTSTAALMGVSELTIRRMIDAGKIRAVKLGRNLRIPESEVERLIARATRGARRS